MYTDINGQTYKLKGDKAVIRHNNKSKKIEIFPTITACDEIYEVVFPNNCTKLFSNDNLEEFTLHKLLHPTTNIVDCNSMFYWCNKLSKLDLTNLSTDNVTDMSSMLSMLNLSELNISHFNTENVTDMFNMFGSSKFANGLDISNFNTKNVTIMNRMFFNLTYTVDISHFNTENVTDMSNMFANYKMKKLDLSNFNTKNVVNMSAMFATSNIEELDLSNFDTSNCKHMNQMFDNCKSLTKINISNFNTKKLKSFNGLFNNCDKLTQLDLSNFNIDKTQYNDIGSNMILANYNTNHKKRSYDKYAFMYDVNCNNKYSCAIINQY